MPQVTEVNMDNKVNRRNYFKKAGLAAIGTIVLSSYPVKLFSKYAGTKKLNVKIHPSAVSRKVKDNSK
jgi:hypothetical protein